MTTAQPLDFDWRHAVADDNGVLLPADTMNRGAHAQFLTQFLVARGAEQNYILNLNSGWGGGKSWFIKRWKKTIEAHYPAIYVDAWKNDHSKDPFLCVISGIKTSLIDKTEMKALATPVMEKSLNILKTAAPAIIKGILKKHIADIDEISELIDTEALADGGASLVEDLIKNHEQTTASIDAFKASVSDWLRVAVEQSEGKLNYPLFVFIDELDRCRPTFAIEMLETVKHIFDMKKVVFVIATDKEQLQHSIRAVYGAGFDSARYLDRFFHRSVVLQHDSVDNQINAMIAASTVFNPQEFPFQRHILSVLQHPKMISGWFSTIANVFRMNLRTINLWFDRVEAVVATNDKVDVIFISFLMALYTVRPEIYKKYSYNKTHLKEIDGVVSILGDVKISMAWSYQDCMTEIEYMYTGHKKYKSIREGKVKLATYIFHIDELSRLPSLGFREKSELMVEFSNSYNMEDDESFTFNDNIIPSGMDCTLRLNMIELNHTYTSYRNLCELATTLR